MWTFGVKVYIYILQATKFKHISQFYLKVISNDKKKYSVHFKYKGTSQNSYVGNALMDLKAWINLKTMEIPVT